MKRRASVLLIALGCCTGMVGQAVAGPTVSAAIDIGLSADTPCACGVAPAEVQQLLSALQAASSQRAAVTDARNALAAAVRSLAQIDNQLRSDPQNGTLLQQRQSAVN